MFKFLDRKEKETLVLIPGWGFDCRIFSALDLPYNYILSCNDGSIFDDGSIFGFEENLKEGLRKNNIEKISLLGWSQGAFLACNFVHQNADIVDELIFVSARRKYERERLENIKRYLRRNKRAYLYRFYKECFSEEEAASLRWFKENFLNDYLKTMKVKNLIEGLDWLSRAEINPKPLKKLEGIKIAHGRKDKIAPVEEAMEIKENFPQAKLIVFDNTGHLPFLRKDFKKALFRE